MRLCVGWPAGRCSFGCVCTFVFACLCARLFVRVLGRLVGWLVGWLVVCVFFCLFACVCLFANVLDCVFVRLSANV